MTAAMPLWALSVVMVVAGIGIPVMAALNSGLGVRLAHPVAAAAVLFAAALGLTLLVLWMQPAVDPARLKAVPPQYYLGGTLVAFYVLAVTTIAPRLGVGNAVFAVLLGQLLASAAIDHLGAFGALRSEITVSRAAGLGFMALGVALARS